MAENKLSYLNRNFNDYKQGIINITKQYYPDVFDNINDASIGSWLIEILSDVGDNLNYHIDKSVQETSLDSATEFGSLLDIARTNGLKVPYKKAALVEVELSCNIPIYEQGMAGDGDMKADERYCPYIKRGTKFSNGLTTFELNGDIDFKEQFDENGNSNLQIIPNRDTNGNIISYTYKKLGIATSCQTKVFKKVITSEDIKPFMEVLIPDSNVIGIDSIILKEGTNINSDPQLNEFFVDEEEYKDKLNNDIIRYFEVDNLIDQYRFGYEVEEATSDMIDDNDVIHKRFYNPVWEKEIAYETHSGQEIVLKKCVKGKWKRLKHKFITEYTDNWQLKIIFGAGLENEYGVIPDNAKEFTQYQMSRMTANDYMGVLPKIGYTMYILYKVGGGEISNIATDTLTSIVGLNIEIDGNCEDDDNNNKIRSVRNSITVTNTTPSYGGKDAPTAEEIRYMLKYNSTSQNRCVTLKDYQAKINEIPAKYGVPFRFGCIEENNKVVIYTLGLDAEGHLMSKLAEVVAENMKEYLKQYKMLNDFVEIKSGKIINLKFKLTVYVDNSYDKSEVTKRIIDMVYDYMDIRHHMMGEDIFIGDLEKEISKLDGVINLTRMRIYNPVGGGYSEDGTTQELTDPTACGYSDYDAYSETTPLDLSNEIDLNKSDYMLFSEANSMFEIKNKASDIIVEVKVRN